jgi:hypothetical protein
MPAGQSGSSSSSRRLGMRGCQSPGAGRITVPGASWARSTRQPGLLNRTSCRARAALSRCYGSSALLFDFSRSSLAWHGPFVDARALLINGGRRGTARWTRGGWLSSRCTVIASRDRRLLRRSRFYVLRPPSALVALKPKRLLSRSRWLGVNALQRKHAPFSR